jgi:hypothetical protein
MTFDSIDEPNTLGLTLIWIGFIALCLMLLFTIYFAVKRKWDWFSRLTLVLFLFILLQYITMVWGKSATNWLNFLGNPNTRENIYLILSGVTGIAAAAASWKSWMEGNNAWLGRALFIIALMNCFVAMAFGMMDKVIGPSPVGSAVGPAPPRPPRNPSKMNDIYLVTTIINCVGAIIVCGLLFGLSGRVKASPPPTAS